MKIHTSYFGEVSYIEKDLITFPDGILGFPNLKSYLPISFDGESDRMLLLQSIEEENVSFIVMNPFLLSSSYDPALTKEDLRLLQCVDVEQLSYYVICVLRNPLEDSTVNLVSPIVVNNSNRMARQVFLEDTSYSFRHPIRSFKNKED